MMQVNLDDDDDDDDNEDEDDDDDDDDEEDDDDDDADGALRRRMTMRITTIWITYAFASGWTTTKMIMTMSCWVGRSEYPAGNRISQSYGTLSIDFGTAFFSCLFFADSKKIQHNTS